eukprot:6256301-Prymnesium_polylepis.1
MIVWFAASIVQFATGGIGAWRGTHRAVGYAGFLGLVVGMATAAIWTVKYDVLIHGDAIGGSYTLLLVTCALFNILVAVHHARHRRTVLHKDHALMALMWSLDPALHRLAMWCVRLGGAGPSSNKLLRYAKLPANAALVIIFGTALVFARRVTCATALNVSLQLALFLLGFATLLLDVPAGSTLRLVAIAGAAATLAIVATLIALE